MSNGEPLSELVDDVEAAIKSRWAQARDWGVKWVGQQLAAIVLGALGVGGLLWRAFPWGVAVVGCVVLLASSLYAIYCRKQLVEERMMRRRSYIAGKRVQQRALQSELTLRQVAIGLAGNPGYRRRLYDARTPGAAEVRRAADYVSASARATAARIDASPRAQAARRRGTIPVPAPPDVEPWIRRADVLVAEIRELDAEIQTLSVPNSPKLERALELARSEKRAAHEADRVARERLRAGRLPSPANDEQQLSIAQRPDGRVDVERRIAPRTPEQIARDAAPRTDPKGEQR